MSTIDSRVGRALAGLGGALLIASLFMPWVAGADGLDRNGWELATMADVYFVLVGSLGLSAAITGGWFGFFRPDASLNATADMLAVAAGLMLAWQILFEIPSGASREAGLYLALLGAVLVACGAGDFRVRSIFPALPGRERYDQR